MVFLYYNAQSKYFVFHSMAEPIHEIPHPVTLVTKSAQQEWQDILQLLQEQGVFKFLHTALEALPDITALLVSSVDNPFGKNTLPT